MKRKLDKNDVPVMVDGKHPKKEEVVKSFQELGLDSRLLQAVSKQKFEKPTLVQSRTIPLVLTGHDILARAQTGSGKTAAYLLPIIHSILKRKQTSHSRFISTLILVPTRELAEQVCNATESFSMYCTDDVRVVNLGQKVSEEVLRTLLADSPDIVISTPAKAMISTNNGSLSLDQLTCLIIDEADLVVSYGYEDDLEKIAKQIPKGIQTLLMSATFSSEIETLKGFYCRDPVILKLDESKNEKKSLSQYVVKCGEDEKFLLIYVIFKLKLVKGKCIIFVGDIDRCYRVKLFLEQFGIRSCILNSELPVNSRIHIVDEFNKGVYDIIIASDETEMLGNEEEQSNKEEDESSITEKPQASSHPKSRSTGAKKKQDYGVSRGVDFKNVACVLNFDLPTSSTSYIHRVGRTARAGQPGMALSFVIPAELYRKHRATSIPSTEKDEKVLVRIIKQQKKQGHEIQPFNFDMSQVEAFRYRFQDALKAVTSIAIREARTRELRQEILNSDKLKRHFEENPGDFHHLRHDDELRSTRIQTHLRNIPDYLLPQGGKNAVTTSHNLSHISLRKTTENRIRQARMRHRARANTAKGRRRNDPLQTFHIKSRP